MPFARLQDALRLLLKEELKAFKIISSQQSLLSPLANSDSAKKVLQDTPVSSKSFFDKSEDLSKLSDCSWLYYVLVESVGIYSWADFTTQESSRAEIPRNR